jgi:hypothetical protein
MASLYTLRPDGVDQDNVNWTASSGTKQACVSDQSDLSYITTAAPIEAITFTLTAPTVAGNVGVERIVLNARVSLDNTGQIGLRARFNGANINQARNNVAAETNRTTVEVDYDLTFLRPGGGQWIVDDLANLNVGIHETNWSTEQPYVLDIWVDYWVAETPTQLAAPRETASRMLRQRRTSTKVMTGQVPPEWLDVELLTPFGVEHSDVPTPDGLGYRLSKGARGHFSLQAIECDLNHPSGEGLFPVLEAADLRPYVVHLWDLGHAKNAGPLQDGAALLDGGQARTFERKSVVHIQDPSDGRVVAVQYDNEAITAHGRLIEGESKNYLPCSSFRDGAAGYTDSNDANVSKTTVQYSDWDPTVLFDPLVTRYYTLFEILNNSANGSRKWPTSDPIPANTDLALSIDFRYDVADGVDSPGGWALQRLVDGMWWNNGAQLWQFGFVGNRLGVTIPANGLRRSQFVIPGAGQPGTAVDLHIGMLAGETVGSRMRVFHAQLEAGTTAGPTDGRTWASSRIVTGAATFARPTAALAYRNDIGNRIWPAAGGTLSCKVVTSWSSAVRSGVTNATVAFCYHDENNYAWVGYQLASGQWLFLLRVAGTNYVAQKAAAVTTGVKVAVAARWTSSAAELGLSPHTVSLFVDGVKGIDSVANGRLAEAETSTLCLGHIGLGPPSNHLDGAYSELEITPYVLSDIEIARLAS